MKVHTERCDVGTTLIVGQQDIDIPIPRGGLVELEAGPKPGHYKALVKRGDGRPMVEYTLDERNVPRPVSTSAQL